MFVFLSKFLPQWIYPIGILTILLILALILVNRPRWNRAILIAALAILFLSGNRWTAYTLARSLEWRYLTPADVPQAEAIVVLGGGTLAADYPRPTVELNSAGDRVIYAIRLYQEGRAPHVLVSGGYIEWLNDNPISPAEDMAEIMTSLGVPRESIWMQTKSQNTYEDAVYCSEILKEQNIQRVLLITSAMHMPRSVALFEKQGIEVIPMPTDFAVTQQSWQDLTQSSFLEYLTNLIPSVGNIGMVTNVMKEYIGMLMYRMQGWM